MCNSWDRAKGWKLWLRLLRSTCEGYISCQISCRVQFGGNLVHFAKFPILKRLLLPQFHPIQPHFMESMVITMEYRLLFFKEYGKCDKIYDSLNFFLNTGPYGAGNFKALFLPQFTSELSPTLWEHCLPPGKAGFLLFLAIGHALTILSHFEI